MPPGSASCFQPRRDVDAVAIEIAALDDHVAEIDADAQNDAPVLGRPSLAAAISLLQLDGAGDGVDRAARTRPARRRPSP